MDIVPDLLTASVSALALCVWAGICLQVVFGQTDRVAARASAVIAIAMLTAIGACDLVVIALIQLSVIACAAWFLRLCRGRFGGCRKVTQFSLKSLLFGVLLVGLLATALADISLDLWKDWFFRYKALAYDQSLPISEATIDRIHGIAAQWAYCIAFSVGLGLATLIAAWVVHEPSRVRRRFTVALIVAICGVALSMIPIANWAYSVVASAIFRSLGACVPITVWMLLAERDRRQAAASRSAESTVLHARNVSRGLRYGGYILLSIVCLSLIPPRAARPRATDIASYKSLVDEVTVIEFRSFDQIAEASDDQLRQWTAKYDRSNSPLRRWLADDPSDLLPLGWVGSWNSFIYGESFNDFFSGDSLAILPECIAHTLLAAAALAEREGRLDASLQHRLDVLRLGQQAARDASGLQVLLAGAIQANAIREIDAIRDRLDAEQTAATLALLQRAHANRVRKDDVLISLRCWKRIRYGWKVGLACRAKAMTGADDIDFSSMADYQLAVNTELELLVCALAIQSYEFEHDTLPTSLDVLVPDYLTNVPTSPFTGQPIQYGVNDSSFTLRCPGLPLRARQTLNDIGLRCEGADVPNDDSK